MMVNGLGVNHVNSIYTIYVPRGTIVRGNIIDKDTTVLQVNFGKAGDSKIESDKIKIFIKHLKEVYQIRSGF